VTELGLNRGSAINGTPLCINRGQLMRFRSSAVISPRQNGKSNGPQPANAVRDREVEMSSMVGIVRLKL
jgi:hypothetical protein